MSPTPQVQESDLLLPQLQPRQTQYPIQKQPSLADLLKALCQSFRSRSYRLHLVSGDGLELHSSLGFEGDEDAEVNKIASQAYLHQLAGNREVVVISDIAHSEVIPPQIRSDWMQWGYRGCVFIPCHDVTGHPVGLLELFYDNSRYMGAYDKESLLVQGMTLAYLLQQSTMVAQLSQQRDQKKQELDDFVYSVSHDLKSPIVSVQGFASLLREEVYPEFAKVHKHYFDRVVANIELIQTMVQDLLELSRVGRVNTEKHRDPLELIVQRAVDDFREVIDEHNIRVTLPDPCPEVVCEARQVGLVLGNLIGNAIKFRKEQGPCVVEIGVKVEIDQFEVIVKDNGVGISPGEQQRIFNTFYRAKQMQHIPGTGMGLAVAKKVVEDHGGHIGVESEPGTGSVFIFSWPHERAQ